MDQKKLFKQMLDFQKDAFDNAFIAMTRIQEQGEKMVEMLLDQAVWMPEEGRKAIRDWISAYKKGRTDLKGMADSNFQKVQEYFSEAGPKEKEKAKPAA